MKATLRVLFGVSALALLVAGAPALAAEVDVTGDNMTTGADSNNENKYDVDQKLDQDVDNNGQVKNEAKAKTNTGDNQQKKNTEAGELGTGAVDATTAWEGMVNSGASLVNGDGEGDLEVFGAFLNDTTGADSNNENKLDVDDKSKLDLDNVARVMNRLGLKANTGYNSQVKNTLAGGIDTGYVDLNSGIANRANNSDGMSSLSGGLTSVDVTGDNSTTGADSNNQNKYDIDSKSKTDVDNRASLKTKVRVRANTGDNSQKKNTTGGDITTGSVDVTTDVVNEANNNTTVAEATEIDVIADFGNDTTGANSNNENKLEVDVKSKTDVDNHAKVENKLDVESNTGDNDQNKNTTGGDIDTGVVTIDFSSKTEVNSN